MTERELQALSRTRVLATPELHPPNDYYGHARLLKGYCGRSGRTPLKAVIQHGVTLDHFVWDLDVRADLPVFLCASEQHAAAFERLAGPGKRGVPVGPLIRYVPGFDAPSETAERVLLVFPSHSTTHERAYFDTGALCDTIERLGREFDRVRVCNYWKDVQDARHRAFAARGFECVTAGHIFSPAFLPRLVRILRSASMVFTNEVGSHVLYAVVAGKPVWIRRTDVTYDASADQRPDITRHPNWREILRLFAEPRGDLSEAQRRFVDDLVGAARVRTPAELNAILDDAEEAYRRGMTLKRRLTREVRRAVYYGRLVQRALGR